MSTHIASGAKSSRKEGYFRKLHNLVANYPQIIIVEANNVGSRQIAEIRFALRGRATLLMGKNTMIRTCLRQKLGDLPQLQTLIDLVKDNIGLVFCEEDPASIRKTILEYKVPAPAKQGAIAPCEVVVPAGSTGMDPGQTSFFQALGIATKIVKGRIEIQSNVDLIKPGDKVSASQAVLLNKLNIKPFSYGLKPVTVYDDGSFYPADVLDISQSDIEDGFKQAAATVAALSLATSFPTLPAIPYIMSDAFRMVCGVAMACDYEFEEMKALTMAPAVVPATSAAPAETKAEEQKEEEEEEEDDDMGFSLFD